MGRGERESAVTKYFKQKWSFERCFTMQGWHGLEAIVPCGMHAVWCTRACLRVGGGVRERMVIKRDNERGPEGDG